MGKEQNQVARNKAHLITIQARIPTNHKAKWSMTFFTTKPLRQLQPAALRTPILSTPEIRLHLMHFKLPSKYHSI